jgi:hypothetical protein
MKCWCHCKKDKQGTTEVGKIIESLYKNHSALRIIALLDSTNKVQAYISDIEEGSGKTEAFLFKALQFKSTATGTVKELGFDRSKEICLKSDDSVIFLFEIENCTMIFYFLFDELNSNFFNPNKFLNANEPILIQLQTLLQKEKK